MLPYLRNPLAIFCTVLLSLTFAGCGGSMVPVTGIVTLSDGQPASGAHVVYTDEAKGTSASGKCDESGRYTLTTIAPDDGVPPGTYVVTIHAPAPEDSSQSQPPRTFHERYENPSTSGLAADVGPAKQTFDFKLEPPAR